MREDVPILTYCNYIGALRHVMEGSQSQTLPNSSLPHQQSCEMGAFMILIFR
jgi:hypothetical protein